MFQSSQNASWIEPGGPYKIPRLDKFPSMAHDQNSNMLSAASNNPLKPVQTGKKDSAPFQSQVQNQILQKKSSGIELFNLDCSVKSRSKGWRN